MPVIKIWCLPQSKESQLRKLHKAIVSAVVGITELGLTSENDMTVLFVPDMMKYGLGTEIIIEVTGLFPKPERTSGVIQKLAEQLGMAVRNLYPAAKVECFVQQFNPVVGFWSSNEKDSRFTTNAELQHILKLLQTPIEDMSLSVRAFNCLHNYSITTAGAAILLPHVRELNIRNYGISTQVCILGALQDAGFSEKQIVVAQDFGKKKLREVFGTEIAYENVITNLRSSEPNAVGFVENLPLWTFIGKVSPNAFLLPKDSCRSLSGATWEISVGLHLEVLLQKKLKDLALLLAEVK
jgi:hypothetical protein